MVARRQPMAVDLRHIMGALRITTDLERIGDLAKNIAKRAIAIADKSHPKPLMSGIRHMVELALHQLKEVLDAYAERDADKALAVWRHDGEIDEMYNSLFRELLTYMMEDPRTIGICTHLLFGRQEHRARRRSRDQHRRDGALHWCAAQHHRRPSQGRSDELHAHLGHLMAEGGASRCPRRS